MGNILIKGGIIIKKQKSLVKIPDLKDVHIDEALRVLKDELNLISTPAIASPNISFAKMMSCILNPDLVHGSIPEQP